MRLLIYALGGGWGHLVRGLALGRAAVRRGLRVRLLVNSPFAERVDGLRELGPLGELRTIPARLSREAQARAVWRALDEPDWDALVVDSFPRGLGGELAARIPLLERPRVWVHRDLNPDYVARYGLRDFAEHFELLLIPGEDAPLAEHPRALRTAPWLVRDPHERLPRAEARRALGVEDARPLLLVSGAGVASEGAAAPETAARLSRALGDAVHVRAPQVWPLLELLPGADLLVGAGGYNTVHEARACGVPLVGVPQTRLYDRQARRLRPDERARPETLVERVRARLGAPAPAPRDAANGVEQALDALAAWVPAGAGSSPCSI